MTKSISIHEMSKQTGITVRTLRYYDHIGLLKPADKTQGNHRLYGDSELMRLQQIQFLKKLGFGLREIADMLVREEWNWSGSLKQQLHYVVNEQKKLKQTESDLRGLLNSLAVEGATNRDVIHRLIRSSGSDSAIKHDYRARMFEERELPLLERLPNLNSDDPDSLEWIALLGQLNKYGDSAPDSPAIQRIIARMHEKYLEEFRGEEAFAEKLWDIRKSSEQSEQMGLYPIHDRLIALIENAYAIFLSRNN